jgi:REP element-mobilizing transposase RayT
LSPINRTPIFFDDHDHAHFHGLRADYRQRFRWRLYHDGLMTNHCHLLLQRPDPRQLSARMAGLRRADIHHVHRRHGFVGHLFQGRFKSPAMEADSYLLSCRRYIERHPLEAGMVGSLLSDNPWYEQLASSAPRRQEWWRTFVWGEDAKEEAVRRGDWVLGSDAFCRPMAEMRGRPLRRRGRPPTKPQCSISPQLEGSPQLA